MLTFIEILLLLPFSSSYLIRWIINSKGIFKCCPFVSDPLFDGQQNGINDEHEFIDVNGNDDGVRKNQLLYFTFYFILLLVFTLLLDSNQACRCFTVITLGQDQFVKPSVHSFPDEFNQLE